MLSPNITTMERDALFVQMAVSAWNTYIERMNKFLDSITDEQFETEVAPDRNRIGYLVGHLVAIHDRLFELLAIGERSHTALYEPYVIKPDGEAADLPDAPALRQYWKDVHENLSRKFSEMTVDDWFSRHMDIAEEDFAKEPMRNRLYVLINRTNHMAYHYGQLRLVK